MSELEHDTAELVFDRNNPLYVSQLPFYAGIIPDSADTSRLPSVESSVKRVGVFVDDMPQNVITRIYNYKLDYVKFCGNESVTYMENIRRSVIPDIAHDIKFIKLLKPSDDASAYMSCADILFIEH
ncbi:MAG: hypothetical protein NC344_08840 [Bacteroidales bacterium]|nr:hypothetical protein [Bacteroidales bacterium]MCM1147914.1 hypothetical protein [Bacteroidales bacterium]MCM1509275.1 hypothetical protein [Clostridium sp.]